MQTTPQDGHAKAKTAPSNPYRTAQNALRPALVSVLAFSAVVNVLMLTGSVYMLQVYDRVLSSGSVPTLMALFGIVVILYAFLALYDFLRSRILSRAAFHLDHQLGQQAFQRWLSSGLPDDGHAANAQPLRDLESIRHFVSSPAVTALLDLPFVPLFLAVLFIIHPWLGMLTVAGAIIAGGIALLNRALSKTPTAQSALMEGGEREFADRGRRSAEAVVAMGMQGAITDRWRGMHDQALATAQKGSDPSEFLAASSRAFRMLLQSAMLTLGALLVLRGAISPGMIIASSILSGRALAPVDQLIGQWRAIGRASGAHQRLDAVFADTQPEAERIDLPDPTGQITVTRLTKLGTDVPGADRPHILSNVAFSLQPGEGMGVIGNSASGKSTLARLLVGASAADAGEIRLDGATPDQWDPVRLGRKIGYLPQTLEIIPGSIRDNIARFDPEAKDEDVIAAAKLTGVHDMILGLSEGYSTQLAVPGKVSPLSGGQLQRIGLARAVFGMPALVVLDEPNSNLDVAGDDALTKTIAALREAGSVVIVMAHRPSALAAVDKLMILDGGTVKVFGDKAKILAGSKEATTKPAAKPEIKPAATATPPEAMPGTKALPKPTAKATVKPTGTPATTPATTPSVTHPGVMTTKKTPTVDIARARSRAAEAGVTGKTRRRA